MWIYHSKMEAGMRHDDGQPALVSRPKFFVFCVQCSANDPLLRKIAVLLFCRNESLLRLMYSNKHFK